MSSVHQEIPWAGHANYAASKGGVMLLMKSMAQEWRRIRIRDQQHLSGCHSNTDQHVGLGDAGSLSVD